MNISSSIVLILLSMARRTSSFHQGLGATRTFLKLNPEQRCEYYYPSRLVLQSTRAITTDQGYGYLKAPIKFASSPFWMDEFLEYNDSHNTDISYLPFHIVANLPIGTENILRKATKTFIESDTKRGQNDLKLADVLDSIDSEYKYDQVSYTLGNESVSFESRRNGSISIDAKSTARIVMSKVLSFAILHRLPAEIALFLFGDLTNEKGMDFETKKEICTLLETFQMHGWDSVLFPQGLSLRMKRNYIVSRRSRYNPLPRKSLFTRNQDAMDAMEALNEANAVQPPLKLIRNQITPEEITQIENELNIQSELSQRSSIKDKLTFFPNKNRLLKNRLLRTLSKQTIKIRALGRAGFVSYGLLMFILYTCSIIWQWHLFSMQGHNINFVQGKVDAVQRSLYKFSKVFISTYFNPQLTKLHRFSLTVLLVPFGNRILARTQKKLKISADQAVGVISSILLVLSMGIWGLIILGDAAFSRSSIGTFTM